MNDAFKFWTDADMTASLCRPIEVGSWRPSPPPPPPLPNLTEEELTQLPAKVISRDLLRAYQRLGGAEWLVSHPVLVSKMLLRSMSAELNVDEKTDVHAGQGSRVQAP